MKLKSRTNLSRLAVIAMVILMVGGLCVTESCKKTSDTLPNNVTVSGIFRGDTILIYDTIPVVMMFSFDELQDGTVNGGVWLWFLQNPEPFTRQQYRAEHFLGHWEETLEGNTRVEGKCELPGDLGFVSFSGTIAQNGSFQYTVAASHFSATGIAHNVGEYLRSDGNLKSIQPSDYIGTYNVSCGDGWSNQCGGFSFPAFTLTLSITGVSVNNIGSIELSGYFSGTIPGLEPITTHYLINDGIDYYSEVVGGSVWMNADFAMDVMKPAFWLSCGNCIWDPGSAYSCGTGYGINILTSWVCAATVNGSVDMSANLTPVFVCGNNLDYAGKTYPTVAIGNQCWLAQNLNVGTRINGNQDQVNNGTLEKYCYDDAESDCDTYGGLYQWDEAMQYGNAPGIQGICPPEWHIPTLAEYQTLASSVNWDGNPLKATGQGSGNGIGTNTIGFSALLAGRRWVDGSSQGINFDALFWSSTQYYGGVNADYFNVTWNSGNINTDNYQKTNGFSVRCIKN